MSPCPRCTRLNVPHRSSCLYCGERMPNPTAPPPAPPEKKLPSNLDDLVRKAMSGGGLRALQEALSRSQAEPPPAPAPTAPPAPAVAAPSPSSPP
ncbi:MAG TPA: hypothetical protein PKW90_08710, partial [Myxococcota bacterium]|nr:hypothetical protein [Myxococcota bacterium]